MHVRFCWVDVLMRVVVRGKWVNNNDKFDSSFLFGSSLHMFEAINNDSFIWFLFRVYAYQQLFVFYTCGTSPSSIVVCLISFNHLLTTLQYRYFSNVLMVNIQQAQDVETDRGQPKIHLAFCFSRDFLSL